MTMRIKIFLTGRVLQANGLFCAASGLLAIVAAGPLATFLGLPEPLILVVTGIILVPYGLPGSVLDSLLSRLPLGLVLRLRGLSDVIPLLLCYNRWY